MPVQRGTTVSSLATPRDTSRTTIAIAALIAAGLLATGGLLWLGRRDKPRIVVLTCRNMSYYVEGDATPNPPLTFTAGERIQLHLVNHDAPGVLHDVAIDALGVTTDLVLPGQSADVTFRVADRPGTYEYYCRPHAAVMRGPLEVRPR